MPNISPPINPKKEMQVLIIHPERIVFNGTAKAITSVNDKGVFDILPLHGNFVSIIKDRIIVYDSNGERRQLPIEKAILKVQKNKVWIFVGITEQNQAGIVFSPLDQSIPPPKQS